MKQSWDPKLYSRDAAFVSNYGTDLLSMLDPAEGRSLLDLGCGEGALTEKLLSLGWNVTGVDSSEEQVRAALMRGISAKVMNGEHLKFDETFDYVFSFCMKLLVIVALTWILNKVMPLLDKPRKRILFIFFLGSIFAIYNEVDLFWTEINYLWSATVIFAESINWFITAFILSKFIKPKHLGAF